jgi:hypothetical protein
MKKEQPKEGYTPVRASEALVIKPKKSWERLQRAKEFFFADLHEQMKAPCGSELRDQRFRQRMR